MFLIGSPELLRLSHFGVFPLGVWELHFASVHKLHSVQEMCDPCKLKSISVCKDLHSVDGVLKYFIESILNSCFDPTEHLVCLFYSGILLGVLSSLEVVEQVFELETLKPLEPLNSIHLRNCIDQTTPGVKQNWFPLFVHKSSLNLVVEHGETIFVQSLDHFFYLKFKARHMFFEIVNLFGLEGEEPGLLEHLQTIVDSIFVLHDCILTKDAARLVKSFKFHVVYIITLRQENLHFSREQNVQLVDIII